MTSLRGRQPAHLAGPRHMVARVARRPRMTPQARWAALVIALVVGSFAFPTAAPAQAATAFPSDDFNRAALGAPWTVVNPAGDGTLTMEGAGTGDARLVLAVPGGAAHEPWNTNGALRAMRPATDSDFTAVAKFETVPTAKYQIQGIIVEQDAGNWLRFELHHNGTGLRAYAGATAAGATASKLNKVGVAGPESYVRVTRQGDTWTLATSANGTTWNTAGSFSQALDVTSIGVMGGNAGSPAPAYAASVDYFFEASAPVDPEDGPPAAGVHSLTTTTSGPGAITRSPDKASYADGEAVTLTAVPNAGAAFTGWSGAATGVANPVVVTMDGDKSVTATFAADTTPPVISSVAAAPGATSAVVTWTTDEAATSSVSAGPTAAYELGAFGSATPTTSHSVTVTGLAPGTTYHYRVASTNGSGLAATGSDATFTTASSGLAFASDDFNRTTLGAPWAVVNPLGDGTVSLTGAGSPNARLRLGVPANVSHDAWQNANNSVRVMRPAGDVDFVAEAKFESTPTAKYQMQGLLVQQDANNWARFNLHHNGSGLRAYAATTTNGSSTKRIDLATTSAATLWIRVERAGSQWTLRTSTNGTSWTSAGSFSFPMTVTSVGPWAGNSGTPAPAFEAVVDYVFEASAPVVPEDVPPASYALTTGVNGPGSISRAPDQPTYSEGSQVTLTAVPAPGAGFTGWSGGVTGGENPTVVTMDAAKSVTATFQADTTPPVITGVGATPASTAAVVAWTTDEPSSSSVAVGTTTAYTLGSFGSATQAQNHSVTVTGLSPQTTYHFRVASTNGAGLTATAPDATFATQANGGPVITPFYGPQQTVGANGQPQNWYNVLGNVSDPDGVSALSYTLNGGASRQLTIGADGRRLQFPGDFNADIAWSGLQPGANTVVLTARDPLGTTSTATVTLDVQSGAATLPYTTDWAHDARISDDAQVVDGKWTIDGDTIRPVQLGYDRLVMIGDIGWHDYEVTYPVTVHNLGPGHNSPNSNAALVGFLLNWRGHTPVNNEQPARYWYPTGALGWYRWYDGAPKFEFKGNNDSPVVRHSRFGIQFDTTYMFRVRSDTVAGGVQYSMKVWPQGSAEPGPWDLTFLETDGPPTGSFGFIAHHVNVQFGNVTVTSIP